MVVLVGACNLRGIRPRFEISGDVPSTEAEADFATALFQTTGERLVAGNKWRLDANGEVFEVLEEDIGAAQVSLNFALYIWEPGDVSDRLIAALSRRAPKVRCRILVDSFGSPSFEAKVAPRLREIGCEARVFRPFASFQNLFERNHRKIVVIDGRSAYLGGFGVRDEWRSIRRRLYRRTRLRFTNEWREDNIRVEGPVVADVQRAFAQNWQEAGGALLPTVDFPAISAEGSARALFCSSTAGYVTDSERLVHLLVKSARRRLFITNAYFVPDPSLLRALVAKAEAGVDVRVLVPGRKNDIPIADLSQRAQYRELLDAGIRIFEYQSAMMHAKTMIIDDRISMIGSLNLNLLSLSRLEEAVLVIDDRELVKELDASWLQDIRESREVRLTS